MPLNQSLGTGSLLQVGGRDGATNVGTANVGKGQLAQGCGSAGRFQTGNCLQNTYIAMRVLNWGPAGRACQFARS